MSGIEALPHVLDLSETVELHHQHTCLGGGKAGGNYQSSQNTAHSLFDSEYRGYQCFGVVVVSHEPADALNGGIVAEPNWIHV